MTAIRTAPVTRRSGRNAELTELVTRTHCINHPPDSEVGASKRRTVFINAPLFTAGGGHEADQDPEVEETSLTRRLTCCERHLETRHR